jgi:hypothetical protein
MLVVHSFDGPSLAQRLTSGLRSPDASTASSWEDLALRFRQSRAAVIGCVHLTRCRAEKLSRLTRTAPNVPVALVTDRDPEGMVWLKLLTLAEVIFLDEAEDRLPSAFAEIDLQWFFRSCAERVERSPHFPERVREILGYTLMADPPPRSVEALARRLSCSSSTLRKAWRNTARREDPLFPVHVAVQLNWINVAPAHWRHLRLEDLLSAIRTGRVIARRRAGSRWTSIGEEFGVTEKSLRAQAKRISGLTPGLSHRSDEFCYRSWLTRILTPQ